MKRPTDATVGSKHSLTRLDELARLDAQRPGNIGAGLKVLEALMTMKNYRPASGARA